MSAISPSAPAVVVVGLGRVGAQAPSVRGPEGGLIIRNHIEAVKAAGGRIVGFVDPCADRRREARTRYDIGAEIPDADRLSQLAPAAIDVVTIATPPVGRLETLAAAIALRPKSIVLEKPPAANPGEAERAVRMAQEANVDLYVAFNRRTDPGMRRLLGSVDLAGAKAALFRYGKGLVNYGSHAVDHALAWFGPAAAVQASPAITTDLENACISFRCFMQSGLTIDFIGVPDVAYDVFEAEIFLTDRVVGFRNNGVEKICWQATGDLYYPGYTGLVPGPAADVPRPIGGFVEMYEELFAAMRERRAAHFLCTGEEGLAVSRLLSATMESAGNGGRVVPLAPGFAAAAQSKCSRSGVEHDQ